MAAVVVKLQSQFAVILKPKNIKSVTVSIFSTSICHEVMGTDVLILVVWMLSFKPVFSLFCFTLIKRFFSSFLLVNNCIFCEQKFSPCFLEESVLTFPCLISLTAFVIIITYNGQPQRLLSLSLTISWSAFVQNPVHLEMTRRKKLTNPAAQGLPFQEILTRLSGLFILFPHLPQSLIHKRCWHPDSDKMFFWGISLPSSWSASFQNKVIFLASTPHLLDSLAYHAVSRASLDSVTCWG